MLVTEKNFPTDSNAIEESHFAQAECSKVTWNSILLATNPGQKKESHQHPKYNQAEND